ncbi:hypothetical protein ASE38_08890 [Cellulomonas sp. Root930]|nr:hypothetical protein ASE38_08890 [Cellulomonas sp. Root930]
MNHDLESALGELADRAEQSHRVGRAPLPVARITARARTRRRTRAAVAIGGAAAAVVIVAGTAFAFLPDRTSPAPPATPSPSVTTTTPAPSQTPTPTPTPTVAPVVLPVGNPALPFGTCGSLASSAPADPVDTRVVARLVPDAGSMASGGHLAVGGEVERGTELGASLVLAVPDGGPRVAVVREGVVVGTAGFYSGTYDAMSGRSGNQGETAWFRGSLDLTVCDPADGGPATPGRPLPAGTYELRPWATVVTFDGLVDIPQDLAQGTLPLAQTAALDGAERATALGEPATVTVTGEADVQLAAPGSDVPLDASTTAARPVCDGPAPAAPVRTAMLDLQVTPQATTFAAGSPLRASGSVQYTGPGRLRAFGYYAIEYWIVRDGIVVGTTVQANDAFSVVDLGAGAPLAFSEEERVLTSCISGVEQPLSDGNPLPAGVYQVYPGWIFSAPVVRLPSETVPLQDTSSGYAVTLGTPFTVTLT